MVVAQFLMKHVKMEFVLITMSIIKIQNLQLIFTQIEKLRLKPPNEPLGLIVYQSNFRKQSFSRFNVHNINLITRLSQSNIYNTWTVPW